MGCKYGHVIQANLPEERPQSTDTESYRLSNIEIDQLIFQSIKSQALIDRKATEIELKRQIKREQKAKQLLEMKRNNPGVQIDEQTFFGKLSFEFSF